MLSLLFSVSVHLCFISSFGNAVACIECVTRPFVISLFFFFKQKTAYEMRISDWSSDVCSSDLPPFYPKAGCRAVRFEIGRVDHDRLAFGSLRCRQAFHHADEDAFVAPPLPAIVERLCRAIFSRRIPPPQPITIDEDDTAQNAPVINPRTAMALRKIGLKTRHLLVRQPIQITHHSGSSR